MPDDAPEPLGKYVTTTCYVYANSYNDMITGRSITDIIHLVNNMSIG